MLWGGLAVGTARTVGTPVAIVAVAAVGAVVTGLSSTNIGNS